MTAVEGKNLKKVCVCGARPTGTNHIDERCPYYKKKPISGNKEG